MPIDKKKIEEVALKVFGRVPPTIWVTEMGYDWTNYHFYNEPDGPIIEGEAFEVVEPLRLEKKEGGDEPPQV